MNGPQHYAEAERLLAQAAVHARIVDRHVRQGATAVTAVEERLAASHIAAAQVHATLALAAATALEACVAVSASVGGGENSDLLAAQAWDAALGSAS